SARSLRDSARLGARFRHSHRLSRRPTDTPGEIARARVGPPNTQAAQRICHDRPLGAYCSFPFEVIGDSGPALAMHRTLEFLLHHGYVVVLAWVFAEQLGL